MLPIKVLKITIGDFENASRDRRELSAIQELGYSVVVLAKGQKNEVELDADGFEIHRRKTRSSDSGKIIGYIQRVIAIPAWAIYAHLLHPDAISGHDIVALFIGWLSILFITKKKRPKLIYDSHEFELGRAAERNKTLLFFIKHLEKYLMKRCAFSIRVNDSIAEEVQKIHKLKKRPIVVRSTPTYWELDATKIAKTRSEICQTLGVPENTFLIMYHGVVTPQRNIEALIESVSRNPNIAGIVLGNASPESYLKQLKNRAEDIGVEKRIYFHPAVPMKEMYKYVGAANVGMILHKVYAKNAEYSLPNKFFENIQSMTPLISTNTLVLREYINKFGIGLTVDITQESEIDASIKRMQTDSEFYQQCKINLKIAKEELCWENEKKVLKNAYKGYINANENYENRKQ